MNTTKYYFYRVWKTTGLPPQQNDRLYWRRYVDFLIALECSQLQLCVMMGGVPRGSLFYILPNACRPFWSPKNIQCEMTVIKQKGSSSTLPLLDFYDIISKAYLKVFISIDT